MILSVIFMYVRVLSFYFAALIKCHIFLYAHMLPLINGENATPILLQQIDEIILHPVIFRRIGHLL